ncbi:josephin-2-like [Dreissena polymorpha]|uniref:ubiquitinyl hydrolase 1 n=1 Tax=Dreissena polymorpha TaxID=45954 RepID=A0A9D4LQR6_DREPO|nr:josephin-2-like [Dreissena polymorpha]XP_052262997.1 josephin-2-like [Dreissena polymorpha]KAH3863257.1 hypothetical protein DPMN_026237 [Dreissena polymorpha]
MEKALEGSQQLYHERQRKQLCALHILNNFFQAPVFKQSDLDEICTRLTPQKFYNPHRGILGLGNYDINVITAALQSKDLCLVWFDKRKNISDIEWINVQGVILNIPSDWKLGFIKLPFGLKHWILLREINNTFYNLDSRLSSPELMGTRDQVSEYISKLIANEEKTQVLFIVKPKVEETGAWYKSGSGGDIDSNLDSDDSYIHGGVNCSEVAT